MRWLSKWLRRPEVVVQPVEEKPLPLSLIGQIGLAVTPLRTSGFIEIEGHRYEVFSIRGFVPRMTSVRIVGRRMGWWTVEPVESEA